LLASSGTCKFSTLPQLQVQETAAAAAERSSSSQIHLLGWQAVVKGESVSWVDCSVWQPAVAAEAGSSLRGWATAPVDTGSSSSTATAAPATVAVAALAVFKRAHQLPRRNYSNHFCTYTSYLNM
jgi:hypothetical protein